MHAQPLPFIPSMLRIVMQQRPCNQALWSSCKQGNDMLTFAAVQAATAAGSRQQWEMHYGGLGGGDWGRLQVDGKELKGDAEVAAEGERLVHVHHTAAGLPVLHATTALSPTTPPHPSNLHFQQLTLLYIGQQYQADRTQPRRRKEEGGWDGGGIAAEAAEVHT